MSEHHVNSLNAMKAHQNLLLAHAHSVSGAHPDWEKVALQQAIIATKALITSLPSMEARVAELSAAPKPAASDLQEPSVAEEPPVQP